MSRWMRLLQLVLSAKNWRPERVVGGRDHPSSSTKRSAKLKSFRCLRVRCVSILAMRSDKEEWGGRKYGIRWDGTTRVSR